MDVFLGGLDPWVLYLTIGLLTFGESAAFLGLVLPGEVGLVAAAALASMALVDPVTLAGVAVGGATVGGMVGYEIGARAGPRLMRWQPIAVRLGRHLEMVAARLDGGAGPAIVVLARFNQVTRALVPAVAGMTAMRRPRFIVANVAGAALWAAVFTSLGFYAAEWWRSSSQSVQVILAVVLAAAAATWWALSRR